MNANLYGGLLPVMPLGLCYVAASLEKAGYRASILDLAFDTDPREKIVRALRELSPAYVGIGIRNMDRNVGFPPDFMLPAIRDGIVSTLKGSFSGPIVIGGAAVGINAAAMLEYLDLPYAIRGDGESAIVDLLDRLGKGAPLDGVPGLVARSDDAIVIDNPPARIEGLDGLPSSEYPRFIDTATYRRRGATLQVQTKRGCEYACVYCIYNFIEGSRYRLRDPSAVAAEIERLTGSTGMKDVEFVDSTFNAPLDHCKAVLGAVIGRDMRCRFSTMGINPGSFDEELASLMKEAGFLSVCVNAEAGNDAMLAALGKDYTVREIRSTAALLRKAGIPVQWILLLGAPGETAETARETLLAIEDTASRLDMIIVTVGIRVYKGAPIARILGQRQPSLTKDDYLTPVDYVPDDVTLEELVAICEERDRLDHRYVLAFREPRIPTALQYLSSLNPGKLKGWQSYVRMKYIARSVMGKKRAVH